MNTDTEITEVADENLPITAGDGSRGDGVDGDSADAEPLTWDYVRRVQLMESQRAKAERDAELRALDESTGKHDLTWKIVSTGEGEGHQWPNVQVFYRQGFVPGWVLEVELNRDPDTGTIFVAGMRLDPVPGRHDQLLTSPAVFKHLQVGKLHKHLRESLRNDPELLFFLPVEWQDSALYSMPRPGRAKQNPLVYAQLAAKYVDALQQAPDRPVAWLAEQEDCSYSSLSSKLHECRSRGFLTTTGQGKAGGELTNHAKELLTQQSTER